MTADELRQHYFFELNRRHQLVGNLPLPVAILTALLGVAAVYLSRVAAPATPAQITFNIAVAVGAVGIVLAFASLVQCFARGSYGEFDARRWYEYEDELREYARAYPSSIPDPAHEYQCLLRSEYARFIDINQDENIRRAGHLFRARLSLAVAAVALGLAAIPFFQDPALSDPGSGRSLGADCHAGPPSPAPAPAAPAAGQDLP